MESITPKPMNVLIGITKKYIENGFKACQICYNIKEECDAMFVDLSEYVPPTFEEKVQQSLDVIEYHLRCVFIVKRMMVDDGVEPEKVNTVIADIGNLMDEKFMNLPYEEFRKEIWKDINDRLFSGNKDISFDE